MLSKGTYQALRGVLDKRLDENNRQAIITDAFYGEPLLNQIEWEGSRLQFNQHLLDLTLRYGSVNGRPAVVLLLESLQSTVGDNVKSEITGLIQKIEAELGGEAMPPPGELPSQPPKPEPSPRPRRALMTVPVIVALITVFGTVTAALIASDNFWGLFGSASSDTPTVTASQPPTAASTATRAVVSATDPSPAVTNIATPTDTVSAPSSVILNITLFQEGDDALTIFVGETSDLSSVVLRTPNVTQELTALFDGLALMDGVVQTGTCLRLIRTGTQPPLPNDCDPDSVMLRQLAGVDVFWYDSVSNQPQPIAVERDGVQLRVCAAGAPRCEVPGD